MTLLLLLHGQLGHDSLDTDCCLRKQGHTSQLTSDKIVIQYQSKGNVNEEYLLGQSCRGVQSCVVVGVQPDVPGDLGGADPPLGVLHQQPRDEILGLAGDVTPVVLWEHELSILCKEMQYYIAFSIQTMVFTLILSNRFA